MEFLDAGLNVTDNPLIVPPNEMTEAKNIMVGSTLARKPRVGTDYFNTDDSDEGASYPDNPKNTVGGVDGDPILGIYEFWRYESGVATQTLMVRQGSKIWAIEARTGTATDITGSLVLPTTGKITFQAFEGNVYWVSTNTSEGYNKWDGVSASAVAVTTAAATFSGSVSGVTGTVELSADNTGSIGNSIVLLGDGAKTLATLASDWNTGNPANTVTVDSANGGDTPDIGEAMALSGGTSLIPDGVPRYIVSHNGRMYAFGVEDFAYRLYISEFYNAEIFETDPLGTTGAAAKATSLDLDPFGDPAGIVGGVSFQNKFYAFMNRSSFTVTGYTINDFAVEVNNSNIGCIGHHTILPVENDVIYASERGVLTLSSTDKAIESDYGFLSRPLTRLWNQSLNRNLETQYHAAFDTTENIYMLSVATAGSTENDAVLALNTSNLVWTVYEGLKARSLTSYVDTDGVRRVVFGREDGVIGIQAPEARTDLGSPYSVKFRTGILFPGEEMDIEWVFKHVTILASTKGEGTLTLNSFIDSKLVSTETVKVTSGQDLLGSSFVLGQSALGNGVFVPQTFKIGGKGYGLQLEVIFSTEDETEVYGFFVDAVAADHRIAGAP